MLERTIKTSQGQDYKLTSEDDVVIDWFNRSSDTHTDIIIDQLNQGWYNEFFAGKKNLTVIDAGANIGLFSLYVQDSCKKLISVEPAPHNLYILEQFLANFSHVEIEMSAVNNVDTTVPFYIHTSPTCCSTVNDITGIKVDVQAKTIATIMADHKVDHVDFIKCDIEGSEMQALTDETIGAVADKIDVWWLEIHQTNANTGAPWPGDLEDNRQKLNALFQKHGYQTRIFTNDQLYAWKQNV
jgi:FkbM family methyltransferase